MKQSALRSELFLQRQGIGLDNYKSKEFMSRVVVLLEEHLNLIMIFQQMIKVIQNLVLNWEKMYIRNIRLEMSIIYLNLKNIHFQVVKE